MFARGQRLLDRARAWGTYERRPRLPRHSPVVSLALADCVFWVAVALSYVTITLPVFRYVAFSIPFLVLLTVLGDRKVRMGDELRPFALLLVWGLALGGTATPDGWKDFFFVFSGVSIALVSRLPLVNSAKALGLTILCMCIYFPLFGKNLAGGISFDFASSESSFESNFSFLLGLIAVIALMEKRKWIFVLAVLLTVITLKRIAVVGVALVCVAYLLEKAKPRLFINPFVMVLVNTLFLLMCMGYGLGYFDYWIREFTGESANQFGMGRRFVLEVPAKEMLAHPWTAFFTGSGPGTVYELMSPRGGGRVGNLHSDLIKLAYEYGYVFSMIFIALGYRAKSLTRRLVFLYFNVLLLTDNVLIYYFFLFFLMVYPRAAVEQEEAQAAVDNKKRVPSGHTWQAYRARSS